MTWLEIAGYVFKFLGQILDLHSKNALTKEQLDAAVAALQGPVPPPS